MVTKSEDKLGVHKRYLRDRCI